MAFRYRDAFADRPSLTFVPQAPYGLSTNWLSCFLVGREAFGASRDEVVSVLASLDIEARALCRPRHSASSSTQRAQWAPA